MEASAHKVAEVRKAQEAGLVGSHFPAATLLELIYAVALTRFDSFGSDGEAPPLEIRRRAIGEAVARLVRP